jgi:molybdenum cofactor cytidylyltransferase
LTRSRDPAGPVVGLLLAAGIGRRFDPGGGRDKLLAETGGLAVATRSARSLAGACERVLAVVRPGSAALRDALAAGGSVELVECADAHLGMGHSLACGALAAAELMPRRLVVALADMPWLDAGTIRALVDAADAATAEADAAQAGLIVVPEYRGQRGHPVVFGAAHLASLARCEGDRGAAALLAEYPVLRIAVDDAGVIRDVDKPEDLPSSSDED